MLGFNIGDPRSHWSAGWGGLPPSSRIAQLDRISHNPPPVIIPHLAVTGDKRQGSSPIPINDPPAHVGLSPEAKMTHMKHSAIIGGAVALAGYYWGGTDMTKSLMIGGAAGVGSYYAMIAYDTPKGDRIV